MIDWLACVVVKGLGALFCRLPPAVAVWVGERMGDVASWGQPKRTRIGLSNLRAAFDGRLTPAQAQRILRACYRQLGAGLVELLRLPAMDHAYLRRYVLIEHEATLQEAVASGRPLMFLTGHYGNWELCSIAAALLGHPIVALARAQRQWPRLYRLLVSYRESKGCTVIHKGGAMRQLIVALSRGRPIGIVGDQASRQGVFIEFFGRPALFAKGPFELAYDKEAIIVPAFIRRRHGPYHRLTIEAPIHLARTRPKAEAVRSGIQQFAALLSRHIQEDPAQWLWMHKRWKHTPARRALILSDGKRGHVKQSLAVVEALRAQCPGLTHEMIEVRYRHRFHRLIVLLWGWLVPGGWGGAGCLQWALTPETAHRLLARYADLVISCGASTAPVNALWARENRARSIVLMNPAPLPLRRFHLVIAPKHDAIPQRPNVVPIIGALSIGRRHEPSHAARLRLEAHPRFRPPHPALDPSPAPARQSSDAPEASRALSPTSAVSQNGHARLHPIIAVFIGGTSGHYDVTPAFVETLITQVLAACEALNGACVVTTSRRTSTEVERQLSERLGASPHCRMLLVASRDDLEGTMDGFLGAANVAVVTGESVSMVSEACASGCQVVIVEPPLKHPGQGGRTKHAQFLHEIATEDYGRLVPLPEVSMAIRRATASPQPARRLENLTAVRDALSRLL